MTTNQTDDGTMKKEVPAMVAALTLDQVIGHGAFSTVHKGMYNSTMPVAIKRQKVTQASTYINRELALLQETNHPRLVQHIGSCTCNNLTPPEVWIVSEYMAGGDVAQILALNQETHVTWVQCIQIALDAAQALAYLHDQGIIHRDIKSANLLLDDKMRCKLGDFGMARRTETGSHQPKRRMSLCGTDAYMAPEMYISEEYDERADVFSLGVVLMELGCRQQASHTTGFMQRWPQTQFRVNLDAFRAQKLSTCPPSLALLAESCVAFEPDERPVAREVVEWLEDLAATYVPLAESSATKVAHRIPTTKPTQPPTIQGTLERKSRRGFIRWWAPTNVIVVDTTLSAFRSTKALDATKHGHADFTLDLRACTLHHPSQRRFVLVDAAAAAKHEFQASSAEECRKWVAALCTIMAAPATAATAPADNDVSTWLARLELPQYAASFQAKGFHSLAYLRETGLVDEDFFMLGIDDAQHQMILARAASNLQNAD
ncbi:TKL/LISK/LISK-DD1 protein kinase, variant 1 [Aphanomyces invadans]|uniref:TKL/LISK/LISK-DD1 protein kinase, variant 1 n=1 Tax=Aphanomyces invadans TaxID=157072 RepID=A0A024UTB4_9STRA|nr:TKL/LISK/LISK-DD1 protein kinase, variant 1 [Aphanomyces invadans]ETW09584.1 TKL/LISK/LISK-DD1 protein kinase, variant 1 [Aphanomyces invadans]|eukprot:XP_008860996.1 TKL/LISK/LISK-DD1 protein kinase, variant 1 [Aphanomyces invadans]